MTLVYEKKYHLPDNVVKLAIKKKINLYWGWFMKLAMFTTFIRKNKTDWFP